MTTSSWFDDVEVQTPKTLFILTVLTLTSVVARAAPTRPRHSVTRAVVLTGAFELAVGAKHARGAF